MLKHRLQQAVTDGTEFSFGDPPQSTAPDGSPPDPAIASLVDEGLEGMPEVNETVVAQLNGGEDTEIELDSDGAAFDATLHATGADGKGVRTSTGKWRKRRGSKGVSSTLGTPKAQPSSTSKSVETDEEKRAKAAAVGAVGANAIFMLGQAIGGEEWSPISINKEGEVKVEQYDERAMMERAIADYAYAKGTQDLPPWLGLSVALTAYALPRFRMPKTQSRLQAAKAWIAGKYVSWRMRKKGGSDGAQSTVRNDGERKDQPRQATR